jgi:hypothetical protein
MAGNIFISYRRSDDPGFAQALYLRREQEFPGESLFMDVEGHIKPGDDFEAVLNAQVAQCDVLLAIIGERWIDARNEEGRRRLEKDDDFVRIEIASALGLGKRVSRADADCTPSRVLQIESTQSARCHRSMTGEVQ